jgi:membrane fusion protein (multidrug efflux system)
MAMPLEESSRIAEKETVYTVAIKLKEHKWLVAIVVVVFFAIGGLGYYLLTRGEVSTDDAYVDGRIFTITPRVSGYITQIYAHNNDRVKKGQPLVALDPTPYEVALAQAKATLAQNRFTMASLQLGVPLQLTQTAQQVREAEAELHSLEQTLGQLHQNVDARSRNVQQLQAQYNLQKLDLERNKTLRKDEAIAQQTLDNSMSSYRAALAGLQGARAQLEAAKKQLASQEAEIEQRKASIAFAATGKEQAKIKARQTEAQKAAVELAEAQLKQAELNLSYTTIVAPTDGYVTEKQIQPGQFVSPGQDLFAVVPLSPNNIWITANYKETALTDVRPGQPVDIKVDTYPGVIIKGKVKSIMAGTGAVFSLFPPENATGNFVKVVQRIPVRITINKSDSDLLPTLRIGMSVEPTIYTRQGYHGEVRNKQMARHSSSDAAHSH